MAKVLSRKGSVTAPMAAPIKAEPRTMFPSVVMKLLPKPARYR